MENLGTAQVLLITLIAAMIFGATHLAESRSIFGSVWMRVRAVRANSINNGPSSDCRGLTA